MKVGDVEDVGAGDDVAPVAPLPPVEDFEPHDSRTLVGGLGCLIRLQELDIAHQHLPALRGVNTPVRVTGPVGGIVYRPLGRQPLNADCRLVLALHRAAPYLLTLGVTEVQFSGAYSYRRMPGGRLSRHALGLAIDVHRVVADGELLDVREYRDMAGSPMPGPGTWAPREEFRAGSGWWRVGGGRDGKRHRYPCCHRRWESRIDGGTSEATARISGAQTNWSACVDVASTPR